MGSLHHAHATTMGRVRKEIQDSSETLAVLAARYPINPKTVWPWKHAGRLEDATSGPRSPRSTVLAPEEEQAICEFRCLTRFSVDDVYISRKPHLPALSRSNLHRCAGAAWTEPLGAQRQPPARRGEKKAVQGL
ncbi:MAG: hypothetical protein O2999_08185 [Nitrospirae bacterium]|nr:hypothetical protein [Nitrospirota bacterium]MDA1304266.1 hypothetical protein [Nitrospirota bacterium]